MSVSSDVTVDDVIAAISAADAAKLVRYERVPAAMPGCQICASLGRSADRCVHGRPYRVWRKHERAMIALDMWSRLMMSVPHGGIHHSRTWNWTSKLNGGRYEARPSGVVDLTRADGGNAVDGHDSPRMVIRDPSRYAPCAKARAGKRSDAVRITFPDWAIITPCA